MRKSSAFLKKSTITSVIGFLLYFIIELTTTFIHTEKPLPASDGSIELFSNQTQDDLTHLYVSSIDSAKESVLLVIYSLTDPQVLQALKRKTEASIPVSVVCDAKASRNIAKNIPLATVVKRSGEGLTHQKILIIDRKRILLGSANLTRESLQNYGNLVASFDHPALADILSHKVASMDDEGHSASYPHIETQLLNQHVELSLLPDDTHAVQRIIQQIRTAKKTIKVAMFTWTRHDLAREIVDAASRGVKVEIVIDRYSGRGASAPIVKLLNKADIPIRLYSGKGLLHHKFAYIDESVLIQGSANWTLSAFTKNDDCIMILYPLTPPQQNKMNQLWKAIDKQSIRAD